MAWPIRRHATRRWRSNATAGANASSTPSARVCGPSRRRKRSTPTGRTTWPPRGTAGFRSRSGWPRSWSSASVAASPGSSIAESRDRCRISPWPCGVSPGARRTSRSRGWRCATRSAAWPARCRCSRTTSSNSTGRRCCGPPPTRCRRWWATSTSSVVSVFSTASSPASSISAATTSRAATGSRSRRRSQTAAFPAAPASSTSRYAAPRRGSSTIWYAATAPAATSKPSTARISGRTAPSSAPSRCSPTSPRPRRRNAR